MRKMIIIGLLLIVATNTFCQQTTPSPSLTEQDYLTKSKHQKTTAWIMMGGGSALFCASAIIGAHAFFDLFSGNIDNAESNIGASGVMGIIGTAAMLGSIPFFIASSKNKRKAMSLSFKAEPFRQIQKNNFVYKAIPSLALKINL
jgi:hypothetical protein